MERLKKLRSEKKLNQEELGLKLNLSQQTISAYENGSKQPPIDVINQLANFFGVSVDYLLGRVQEKSLHVVEGDAIPQELREIGVEYLEIAKQMQDDDLSPEEVKKILDAVKNLKK